MKKNDQTSFCPIIKVDQEDPSHETIRRTVEILLAGGVIIYPTDTLYGFGALINNHKAIEKLYQIKGRDQNKPFSVLINSLDQVEQICGPLNDRERAICNAVWPGKVTLLIKVKNKPELPVFKGLEKIGFRYPLSKFCYHLIKNLGIPISSSSVNRSEGPNMSNVEEMAGTFSSELDLILDAGPVKSLKGSTVLDISKSSVVMLREGEATQDELDNMLKLKIYTPTNKKYIITFICSGNICRSPMAEGILKDRIKKSIFEASVEVNSAGTLNLPPDEASENSILSAREHKIDISLHSSRPLSGAIVDQANMIICLADNHYTHLKQNYPEHMDKVHLLKTLNVVGGQSNSSIADPIGRDKEFYSTVYKEIESEIERILPYIFEQIDIFLTAE